MNWKIFSTAFVSVVLLSFPQNIIGCGPDVDPYDYYTSFFNQQIPSSTSYKPFYYSGYVFLYDETDPVEPADLLAKEWAAFCGTSVSVSDAKKFVNTYSLKELNNLYQHIEKKQRLVVSDSVLRNSMTKYFINKKDLEGLGYILYAKKVEPSVVSDYNSWDPITTDSIKMNGLIKNGTQLYAAAKNSFYKLKYGYQLVRLAHYNGRYQDAIQFYESYIVPNKTPSVLQPMSVALKAGAHFRLGQNKEAAYFFSKAFSETDAKKISNYTSFLWSVNKAEERATYYTLCKNDREKANMMALFALGSVADETEQLKNIFDIDPTSQVLEVLAIREINKLEETYFTKSLQQQKGGTLFYYAYETDYDQVKLQADLVRVQKLQELLHTMASSGKSNNAGLFETGAAYCALMAKDFITAREYLKKAAGYSLTGKMKDQWMLTNLLLSINETAKMDAAFENKILPSLQWLQQKALASPSAGRKEWYSRNTEWIHFYRDILTQVMAKRYRQQGNLFKEALCIGAADGVLYNAGNSEYGRGNYFLRTQLQSKDVLELYNLLISKKQSSFEKFLIQKNSISIASVVDFAGTAYLRDMQYDQAVSWFKKAPSSNTKIQKDPFIELLYDREEFIPGNKTITSKMLFAAEMLRLQKLAKTDKLNASKHLYKMALGLYNTTYYGYAWELVAYERSGSDGYHIPDSSNSFHSLYYGCTAAHDYFKKAMDLSSNKDFKAICLFMMAKCKQKQIRKPQYNDFGYDNWEQYSGAENRYQKEFWSNPYFPSFVSQYKGTPFYEKAYNSCSYLRDFESLVNK